MKLGLVNTLKIIRETDISYLLTDGENEIFLHKKEALKPYLPGDSIDVFIYVDNLGRPTASTKTPFATMDQPGFLEVVNVNVELGIFLHYGMVKDVLLSKDFLPVQMAQWPKPGDRLFVILKEKKELLFARQVSRKSIAFYLKDPMVLEEGTFVDAYVQFILLEGLVAFTSEGHEIFIHYNNTRKTYRLGEAVHVRVLKLNENGEYVGSLIGQKETMLDADAQIILEFIKNHGGSMRFTDKSLPEEIQAAFHMSKGAFKRALGTLYKTGLIDLTEHSTTLKTI
jgi:uncharacterized protein